MTWNRWVHKKRGRHMKSRDVIRKAAAALEESVDSIIHDGSLTEAKKMQMLAKSFAQCQGYLQEEFPDGQVRAGDFVKQLEWEGDLRDAVAKLDEEEKFENMGREAGEHHASKVADLLVESGKFPDRRQALDHLLHSSRGQALLGRMSKQEDPKMTPQDKLRDLVKRAGIVAVAKAIVDERHAYGIDEHEYVSPSTRSAGIQT
jgi:hypothetical protein